MTAFLLLLMIAAAGTYWVLVFTSGRTSGEAVTPISVADSTPRSQPPDVAAVVRLFGDTASVGDGSVVLTGVIAQGGAGKGVAILSVHGAQAAAVQAGAEVAPGVVLSRVHSDSVVLLRQGSEVSIVLTEKPKAQAPMTAVPAGPGSPSGISVQDPAQR